MLGRSAKRPGVRRPRHRNRLRSRGDVVDLGNRPADMPFVVLWERLAVQRRRPTFLAAHERDALAVGHRFREQLVAVPAAIARVGAGCRKVIESPSGRILQSPVAGHGSNPVAPAPAAPPPPPWVLSRRPDFRSCLAAPPVPAAGPAGAVPSGGTAARRAAAIALSQAAAASAGAHPCAASSWPCASAVATLIAPRLRARGASRGRAERQDHRSSVEKGHTETCPNPPDRVAKCRHRPDSASCEADAGWELSTRNMNGAERTVRPQSSRRCPIRFSSLNRRTYILLGIMDNSRHVSRCGARRRYNLLRCRIARLQSAVRQESRASCSSAPSCLAPRCSVVAGSETAERARAALLRSMAPAVRRAA